MKLIPEFTEKLDKIYGRKSQNARIFKHSGNWSYRPAMFYAKSIEDAFATSSQIEADLYVWSPKEEKWICLVEVDLIYGIGSEFEDGKDICLSLLDRNLEEAGYKMTFEELRSRRGHHIQSAYQGLRRIDIPDGAYELVPGLFI